MAEPAHGAQDRPIGAADSPIEVVPVVVISQVFTARPSSIPDIRDFVRRCLSESPLTDEGTREVGETVFRALLDAAGPTGSIQVAFRIFPEHVEVDVLHSDTTIQPPTVPGPPRTVVQPVQVPGEPGPFSQAAQLSQAVRAGAPEPPAPLTRSAPEPAAPAGPARYGPDGSAPHGPAPDGSAPAGPAPDGSAPAGSAPDDPVLAGSVPDGSVPDGSAPAGASSGASHGPRAAAPPGSPLQSVSATPATGGPPQPGGPGPHDNPETFAEWMSSALRREGLTQEAAARQLGVSVKTVSRWVGGATEPRMRDLRRIQEVFGEVPLP